MDIKLVQGVFDFVGLIAGIFGGGQIIRQRNVNGSLKQELERARTNENLHAAEIHGLKRDVVSIRQKLEKIEKK